MSFPKYGELAMNIKRPAGEFDKKSDIRIERTKDYAYVTIGSDQYEVFVEPIGETAIEKIIEDDYELDEKDFNVSGIAIDWQSITPSSGESVDDKTKQKIVDILIEHYQSKGYKIEIDNRD
jgi:hypothetical protein